MIHPTELYHNSNLQMALKKSMIFNFSCFICADSFGSTYSYRDNDPVKLITQRVNEVKP